MRKLIAIILSSILLLSPLSAFAAVAFTAGHAASAHTASATTSLSITVTCTGDDMILAAINFRDVAGGSLTAAYNSVSMTASATVDTANMFVRSFYLASPSTGSNTVDFNWTGNHNAVASAICINGTAGTIGATTTATGVGTDASITVTRTLSAGDMIVGFGMTLSAGTGLSVTTGTSRTSDEVSGSVYMNGATNTGTGSISIVYGNLGVDQLSAIGIPVNVAVATAITPASILSLVRSFWIF